LVAFFLFALLECSLIIPEALAEEKFERSGFWGGGYDFPISKNLAITPFLNYSYWEIDDQNNDAWTLGIGLTFQ